MTLLQLSYNVATLYRYYYHKYPARKKHYLLARELWKKFGYFDLTSETFPNKVKFQGSYPFKLIYQSFSELGLKVTRYTREYEKTIVHFEPISDSQQ